MVTNPSKIELIWSTRAGGNGRTERRYRDIVVDGTALSTMVEGDVISPFGWTSPDEQIAAINRLLRRASPDLPGGRVALYVCPECGDLACGAVSLVIDGAEGGLVWRDFGFQNGYDDTVHRDGYESLGPFFFDGYAYHQLWEELKSDAR